MTAWGREDAQGKKVTTCPTRPGPGGSEGAFSSFSRSGCLPAPNSQGKTSLRPPSTSKRTWMPPSSVGPTAAEPGAPPASVCHCVLPRLLAREAGEGSFKDPDVRGFCMRGEFAGGGGSWVLGGGQCGGLVWGAHRWKLAGSFCKAAAARWPHAAGSSTPEPPLALWPRTRRRAFQGPASPVPDCGQQAPRHLPFRSSGSVSGPQRPGPQNPDPARASQP